MPNPHSKKQKGISEEEKRQNIYLVIFLFLCQNKYPFQIEYSFQTDRQLEDFLSNAGLSMADLIQDGEGEAEGEGKHFIVKHFKASSKIGVSRYEETGPNNSNRSVSYRVDLTNFSVAEMLDLFGRIFENVSITRLDMEEAFKIACNNGILRPTMKYQNEVRYEIADPRFENFIFDYNFFYLLLIRKLYSIWHYIRAPNTQEVKWLELFRGRQKTKEILSETYKRRHSQSKTQRTKKVSEVRKFVREKEEELDIMLMIMHERHMEIIKQYQFPTEKIFDITYPKFLQEIV